MCIALLVYNVIYILASKRNDRTGSRNIGRWEGMLTKAWEELELTGTLSDDHVSLLKKRLKKINQLRLFHAAIEPHLIETTVRRYLDLNHNTFQYLASCYLQRPAMERSFFAYVISEYHPAGEGEHDQLAELLLDFMQDSTVYCRENVLKALVALGYPFAIGHAFEMFSDLEIYHHPKLVSDEFMNYSGDKSNLVWYLWGRRNRFSEPLQISIVQFATQLSEEFSDEFLKALKASTTPLEVRFTLVRYFQKYSYPEVREFLYSCAENENELAIPACAALSRYPGADTKEILTHALHSRNWYVRRNAARSLVTLGLSQEEITGLLASNDRYANEMMKYMIDLYGTDPVAYTKKSDSGSDGENIEGSADNVQDMPFIEGGDVSIGWDEDSTEAAKKNPQTRQAKKNPQTRQAKKNVPWIVVIGIIAFTGLLLQESSHGKKRRKKALYSFLKKRRTP